MAAAAPVAVPRMKLGSQGLEVSAQGLGCMGMSAFYGPPKPEPDMVALLRHAVAAGITFLDTSDFYGPHTNELLLGKALQDGVRHKVQLATKFGITPDFPGVRARGVRGQPEEAGCGLHRPVLPAPHRHQGARRGHGWGAQEAGWRREDQVHRTVRSVCINDQESARRSSDHRHPAGVVSLVARCRTRYNPNLQELGIGIVAYSPLGRGFFSGGAKLVSELPDDDLRKNLPRFQPENMEKNALIFERVSDMAARKGYTTSQLALAWVHHQGTDVCPIPGTTKIANFNQNLGALSVKLTPEEMAELESYASMDHVQGDRCHSTFLNTWKDSETPPLSSWKGN
ncbi:unnamed protein product [Urochloa decumbens]|uniref:NADP-dependent oxidoreductase domain-containing protein n=1 Tax=Urochloa decumbens TaxID=240449 RepID=A0ABC9CYL4_9POAL